MLCGRVTPRTGEALGHSETASVTVARTQGRPQAIVSRRCGGVTLASQLMGMSRDGKTHLQILCQPEQQHRARYQTEGSRGAVKDRSGNGFPVVKVIGFGRQQTYPRTLTRLGDQIKIAIFWVIELCGLVISTNVSEVHADSLALMM